MDSKLGGTSSALSIESSLGDVDVTVCDQLENLVHLVLEENRI